MELAAHSGEEGKEPVLPRLEGGSNNVNMDQEESIRHRPGLEAMLILLDRNTTLGFGVDIKHDATLLDVRAKLVKEYKDEDKGEGSSSSLPNWWCFLREGRTPIRWLDEGSTRVLDLCQDGGGITRSRIVMLYARGTSMMAEESTSAEEGRIPSFGHSASPFNPFCVPSLPSSHANLQNENRGESTAASRRAVRTVPSSPLLQSSYRLHPKEGRITSFGNSTTSPPRPNAISSLPLHGNKNNENRGVATAAPRQCARTGASDDVLQSSCRLNTATQNILARMKSSKDVWR